MQAVCHELIRDMRVQRQMRSKRGNDSLFGTAVVVLNNVVKINEYIGAASVIAL